MHHKHIIFPLCVVFSLGFLGSCASNEDFPSDQASTSSSIVSATNSVSEQLPASVDFPSLSDYAMATGVPVLTPEIVQRFSFDPASFTQGLEFEPDTDTLLVGTGMETESRIYRTTTEGAQSDQQDLDPDFFGEGIARTSQAVWQLTWKNGVAIERDPVTLRERRRVDLPGEGWGLCALPAGNGIAERLVLSDGSSTLRFLDPVSFAEIGRTEVLLHGHPVEQLNELDCVVDGDTPEDLGSDAVVHANVFMSTDIVRIPIPEQQSATVEVAVVIDATTLPNNATPDPNNVLNGIAHIPGTADYFLTGKRWPDLYRVRFV